MLFKNVLVPFDESEHAQAALHLAIDLVGDDPGATIHVVTVVSNDIMPPSMISASGAFGEAPVDYSTYESFLSAIAERSDHDLHDSIDSLLGTQDAPGKARRRHAPGALARRRHQYLRQRPLLRPHHHGSPRPWRAARHARQRELRRPALLRHPRPHRQVAHAPTWAHASLCPMSPHGPYAHLAHVPTGSCAHTAHAFARLMRSPTKAAPRVEEAALLR